jgi:hypothetical protein
MLIQEFDMIPFFNFMSCIVQGYYFLDNLDMAYRHPVLILRFGNMRNA